MAKPESDERFRATEDGERRAEILSPLQRTRRTSLVARIRRRRWIEKMKPNDFRGKNVRSSGLEDVIFWFRSQELAYLCRVAVNPLPCPYHYSNSITILYFLLNHSSFLLPKSSLFNISPSVFNS